ncbi:MAG: YIP1 family protein [Caulobacterales bacterium]|nr:YIP1 family protein [Caulobacterales bacterium]
METPRGFGVAKRAVAMLARPDRTFDRVGEESGDLRGLFRRYVAPLAAIPAVCGVIGPLIFGFNVYNVGIHMSVVGLILEAAVGYLLTLAAVYGLGLFVELTAPWFGGVRSRDRAMRAVAYSATAVWVAGLAELYPNLGLPLGVLAALWSLYALYLGLAKLMAIPEERRLVAFAVVLLALAVLGVARGMAVAKAAELGGPLSASYAPRR